MAEPITVLVVDDEPGMRRGAVRSLRDFRVAVRDIEDDIGFSLVEAGTGQEAVDALAAGGIDLVLLDYKLPDFSGLDVLSRIREAQWDVLTVMMTAYASLEVAVSATKNGAFDFLAKPFTPDELKAVVRKCATSLLHQRRARQLEAEKRQVRFQFLSVLSHELKAPLNAVEGYLRLIDDRAAGEALVDYDPMIKRSLARIDGMRKLIFDLLDLTRIESGQKQRRLVEIDAAEVVRKVLETFQPAADARGIAMALDAPAALPCHGDTSEFEIILNNLVSNAIKYNRENGRVEVRLRLDGTRLEIAVADTGIGMTREEQAKLFGEFVRIRNDKNREVEGSGLGLSILKRLTGLYRGEVKVESEPDVGTTFTVVLDVTPEQPEHRSAP
jgi:signal transduction histidine kinase